MNTKNCGHITASSSPATGEAGRTGDWRTSYPVINRKICTPSKTGRASCFICWTYCPEGVIRKSIPPEIDLEYCKGCGICMEECPVGAISLVPETTPSDNEGLS